MAAESITHRTAWIGVAAALASGVLAATYAGKFLPALPAIKQEFGLSLIAAGWVVSIFSVVAVAGGVFIGLAADRFGALRSSLAGCVLLAIGGVAGAAANGSAALLVSRVLEGAGFLVVSVAAPALIFAASAPADRRLGLGIWSAYMGTGMALVVLAAPIVIAAAGWRSLWIAIAALTLASAAALWLLRERFPRPPAQRPKLADVSAGLRHAGAWWTAASMTFYAGQWMAVMVWLPSFLVERRSVSLLESAALTALVIGVNVPGNLTGTWLLQRHARRGAVISAGGVLMALCSLGIFSAAAPDWLRFASCLGLSYFGGIIPAAVLSMPQTYARTPSQVASLQGLIMQMSNLGLLAGPPLIAAVVTSTGQWESSLAVMFAAAASVFVCGQAVNRHERRFATAAAAQ